jgi:hypothetical protein
VAWAAFDPNVVLLWFNTASGSWEFAADTCRVAPYAARGFYRSEVVGTKLFTNVCHLSDFAMSSRVPDTGSSRLSDGAIVGISIAVAVAAVIVVALSFQCWRSRPKQRVPTRTEITVSPGARSREGAGVAELGSRANLQTPQGPTSTMDDLDIGLVPEVDAAPSGNGTPTTPSANRRVPTVIMS